MNNWNATLETAAIHGAELPQSSTPLVPDDYDAWSSASSRPDGVSVENASNLQGPSQGTTPLDSSELAVAEPSPSLEASPLIVSSPLRKHSQISSNGVYVVCEDLTYRTRRKKTAILERVTVLANPGELTVILGPSGSGKTSTLNAISSRVNSGRLSGDIRFNGQPSSMAVAKKYSSYVMAHDYLLPYLTVEETLTMAVKMKQPTLVLPEQMTLVDEVISALELKSCRKTYVGGEYRKGLSTGQIKRLAIAVELLGDPAVFLLDEPTTGLDSRLALQLVHILRNVARKGKTVLCTVHQPSHDAFALFDVLILMSAGCVVYHGPARDALGYFNSLGRTCPVNFNPADFLIEVVTDETAASGNDVESIHSSSSSSISSDSSYQANLRRKEREAEIQLEKKAQNAEIMKQVMGGEFSGPFYSTKNEIDELINRFRLSDENVRLTRQVQEAKGMAVDYQSEKQKRPTLGWNAEFRVLWKRTTLNSVRNPMTTCYILLINIIQAFVLGGIFFQLGSSTDNFTTSVLSSLDFWSNPFIQSMAYGLDLNGLSPFVQMIDYGVDGYNRSILFDVLTSQDIVQYVHEVINCTHRESHLEGYPDSFWPTPESPTLRRILLADDTNSDELRIQMNNLRNLAEMKLETLSNVIHTKNKRRSLTAVSDGESTPYPRASVSTQQLLSDLTQLLQLIDYYLDPNPYYPEIKGTQPLIYWGQVFVKFAPYTDPLLYCLGLPPFTLNYTNNGPTATTPAGLYPHNHFVPFPDRDPYAYNRRRLDANDDNSRVALNPISKLAFGSANMFEYNNLDDSDKSKKTSRQSPKTSQLSAPRRHLSDSGLSGLVKELISLITDNPNSPFYKLFNAFKYYSDAIQSCTNPMCNSINDALNDIGTYAGEMMDTLLVSLNFAGALFFISGTIGFASYDVLVQFPKERPMFNRESANGLYRSSAYYISKNLSDLMFQMIPMLVWSTIIFFMAGLTVSASKYFIFMGICTCLSVAAYGFGYFIAALSPRMEVGIILAPLLLVIMLVLAGFFIRDPMIPGWIGWVKYFSLYRWSYFAMVSSQFPLGEVYGTLPCSLIQAVVGVTEPRIWVCCLCLLALSIGFRICGYISLVFVNRSVGIEV